MRRADTARVLREIDEALAPDPLPGDDWTGPGPKVRQEADWRWAMSQPNEREAAYERSLLKSAVLDPGCVDREMIEEFDDVGLIALNLLTSHCQGLLCLDDRSIVEACGVEGPHPDGPYYGVWASAVDRLERGLGGWHPQGPGGGMTYVSVDGGGS